jgi:hypothetical protein
MSSARYIGTSSGDADDAQAEDPPAWAVPHAMPVNVTLVRQPDLFARVTSACAFPTGFLFFLVVGFDIRKIPFRRVDFYSPREGRDPAPARLQVRFPDGRVASSHPRHPGETMLRRIGGDAHPAEPGSGEADAFRRHETRWWARPLPLPGDLEFSVYLRDSTEVAGTGCCDAGPVLEAASRSVAVWNPAGGGR